MADECNEWDGKEGCRDQTGGCLLLAVVVSIALWGVIFGLVEWFIE